MAPHKLWLLRGLLFAAPAATAKPNFVIIFVDDMGLDQIEVPDAQREYGMTGNNHSIKTPNVYRLASEGLVFQNWYSAYHVCSPSRAAMMTGRLPIRSGCVPGVFFDDAVGGLPPNETTMPEALLPLGYRTMMIGKWHLGQRPQFLPTTRGFQSYFGIPFSQDMGLSWWANCASRGDTPAPCNPPPTGFYTKPLPLLANTTVVDQPAGLYTLAARYAAAAAAFFRDSADAGDPFLLYLPFNHIHAPHSCSEATCGKSARGPVGDATEDMDTATGTVMDAIRTDPRIATNTLVFFTSDNGSPNAPDGNLPLRGYKTQIWEGGFREPGIAWWPGKIKPGALNRDALVATYDIFPTVLRLAGAAPVSDRPIDGMDISPLLFSATPETEAAHDCIMYYHHPQSQLGPDGAAELDSLSAVRCGDYKVYWYIDKVANDQPLVLPGNATAGKQTLDTPVVFDLSTDWSEKNPLSPGSPAWTAARSTALAAREAHLKTLGWAPNQIALGRDIEYVICSDPHSQQKYPQYPNCTISPEFWENPFCKCGNAFRKCNECPTKPPAPPAPPPFPPANSTKCTYVESVRYVHQTGVKSNVASKEACCHACYADDECAVSAWHDTRAPVHNCYLHYSSEGAGNHQEGVVGCVTNRD